MHVALVERKKSEKSGNPGAPVIAPRKLVKGGNILSNFTFDYRPHGQGQEIQEFNHQRHEPHERKKNMNHKVSQRKTKSWKIANPSCDCEPSVRCDFVVFFFLRGTPCISVVNIL
jgi:hypothetical protein